MSFLKQFLSEDSVPRILIALNYQSTSNESNSACWNGLHLVFPSNLTKQSFLCFLCYVMLCYKIAVRLKLVLSFVLQIRGEVQSEITIQTKSDQNKIAVRLVSSISWTTQEWKGSKLDHNENQVRSK